MRLGMIWAQTTGGVIGAHGDMPWRLAEDLAHFRQATTGHPVVMGRRTWDSLPEKFRPLPGRTNIVVTSNRSLDADLAAAGAVPVPGLEEAFAAAAQAPGSDEVWVVGGALLYRQAMDLATRAEITVIDTDVDGDTFAPMLREPWRRVAVDPGEGWHESATGLRHRFESWQRQP